MIFNTQFIGLTPVENTGQVTWKGDSTEGALEAFDSYLRSVYGPNNFKIINFKEAEEIDKDNEPFEIPISPPTSKVLN